MKWEYLKPTKKEICSKGTQMLIVDHELEQVNLMNIHKEIDILKVLNEAKFHHKNIYTVKMFDILYTVAVDKNNLQYITFMDEIENTVLIEFKNISISDIGNMKCNYPNSYDFINN